METRQAYGAPGGEIRPECLAEASRWAPPTPDEIRIAMSLARWSGEEMGRRLDVSGRSVRRWAKGEQQIPYAVWCVLCAQARLGEIWKMGNYAIERKRNDGADFRYKKGDPVTLDDGRISRVRMINEIDGSWQIWVSGTYDNLELWKTVPAGDVDITEG